MDFLKAIGKLIRWKDTLPFTIPVTLLGFALGVNGKEVNLVKLFIVLFANVIAISFTFVINELEDSLDDGKKIDKKLAKRLSLVTFVVAFFLYALLGINVFIIGFSVLILGFLYSWRKIRLKAYPVVDILSHCLMLGGLLFLAGFYIEGKVLGDNFLVFMTITLTSAYGQFYNQVRDFKEDKRAKLRNTSLLLGKELASILMYSFLGVVILLIIYSFYLGVLPLWMLIFGALLSPIAFILKGKNVEKRDRISGVPTNSLHFPSLILLTILSVLLILSKFLGK